MSIDNKKQKPPQKRYNVLIGESLVEKVKAIQHHYGHQTISETLRYLVYQGYNAEMARKTQIESVDAQRELAEVLRQMQENPLLSGLMEGEAFEQISNLQDGSQ